MGEEGWGGGVGRRGSGGGAVGGRGGGGKKGARRRGEGGLYQEGSWLYTFGNQKFISAVQFPVRNSCLIHA